jgi:hypothetical protein
LQKKILELDEEGNFILDPEKFIDRYFIALRNIAIMEYLIQLKNMPPEEATWEYE